MVGFYEYWTRVRSCLFVQQSVATKRLSTNLREVLQCPEKALVGAFFGHCKTSRRFVDSSSYYIPPSNTADPAVPPICSS